MLWRSREPRYDVATAISQGARDYQEDAITSDFLIGADAGFVVLADGMGGHAAGDVASKIVLTEVYSELKFQYADVDAFEARAPEILRRIAAAANDCLREHSRHNPDTKGMGATLVVPIILENRMFWISIGDSPLMLYRDGKLRQINEDHSMAPQIDFMVNSGLMDPVVGANHPDRNCLVSVMMGTRIPKIDCREEPMLLKVGDIVICASDGLQFLSNAAIERIVTRNRRKRSAEIAEVLLEEIGRLNDPDQDNVSFCVIKINDVSVAEKRPLGSRYPVAIDRPKRLTTVIADTNVVYMTLGAQPNDVTSAPQKPGPQKPGRQKSAPEKSNRDKPGPEKPVAEDPHAKADEELINNTAKFTTKRNALAE